MLVFGADFFVSGASAVAKKLRVPTLFIGLTIVSIGTSLPELSVGIFGAIRGVEGLSVGNIIGSNMFNMFVILPVVALASSVPIAISTKKYDIPFLITSIGILTLCCGDVFLNGGEANIISRTEGIILLFVFVIYMVLLISNAKKFRTTKTYVAEQKQPDFIEEEKPVEELSIVRTILYLVFGLAGVIFGGECVSSTSQFLAAQLGMSDTLIGLTVVAVGTSLPELVTSLVAIRKKQNDLAIGNIIGSSIVNICLIIGIVGTISQIVVDVKMLIDIVILFVYTIVFSIFCLLSNRLKKSHSIALLVMYALYFAFAIIKNYFLVF